MSLKRFCLKQGCKSLVETGYCEAHEQHHRNEKDKYRQSAHERGYDSRWRKARRSYLSEHPLCVQCEDEGLIRAADVVDHIKPHKGNKDLFWDQDNWQPLCKRHHDIKTVREDGGFNNAINTRLSGIHGNGAR